LRGFITPKGVSILPTHYMEAMQIFAEPSPEGT